MCDGGVYDWEVDVVDVICECGGESEDDEGEVRGGEGGRYVVSRGRVVRRRWSGMSSGMW